MTEMPTAEQHRALLSDCWALARALPGSGVLDRGRRPYRAIRFERKLNAVAKDPVGLSDYVRGMARRTSDGLDLLVEYNRLDLAVETLILDESKVYAPLFTSEDRAAARAKLARQAGALEDLTQRRAKQKRHEEAARRARVETIRSGLPKALDRLRELAAQATDLDEAIAINTSILGQEATDVVALNRLGRAYEAIGWIDEARAAFGEVLEIDPRNQIAGRRLRQL